MREWIPGRHPVYEVLRAGRRQVFELRLAEGVQVKGRLEEVVARCQSKGIPVKYLSRQALDAEITPNQGVLLQVSAYPYVDLDDILRAAEKPGETPFILILDALQDPQNLGTLLRTAEAVGVHGVLLPLRRTATITPAVVNASSGASEHLRIAQGNLAQAIRRLKEAGIWAIGLDSGPKARPPEQVHLDVPIAVVVGNEGQGMRQLVERSCDVLLRLPMRGRIESLNAAVAGSVALYLVWGARGYPQADP